MNDITALMATMKAAAIAVARDGRTDDEWFYYLQCVHHKNVLALVEALEKAQEITAAAEKLVRCKGRYHSEQNYRALAALFGVNTPDLPPMEGESRTVTVKLPEEFSDDEALLQEIEFCDDVSTDIQTAQWLKELRRRRAAGIQVIEGEQNNG